MQWMVQVQLASARMKLGWNWDWEIGYYEDDDSTGDIYGGAELASARMKPWDETQMGDSDIND